MEVEIEGWFFDCDHARTKAAYMRVEAGGAEVCGCIYCRNFVALRSRVFPPPAIALYERLGVRIDREAEICEAGPVDGLHFYWGWHHFVGSILRTGEPLTLGDDFDVSFRRERHCAWPVFEDEPNLVQIDFSTRLPWTLDEKPPPIGAGSE